MIVGNDAPIWLRFRLNFRSDFLSKIIMRCRIITARIKNAIFQ